MTSKQALEKIKNIELSHIAYYDDDDYYDYDYIPSYEESDGTIEENYTDEIEVIKKALDKLTKLEEIEELCEKIVSQPVYDKFVDTGEIHKEDYTGYYALYDFKKESIDIFYYDFVGGYDLKDYKKTWAFSKEELL